MKTIMLKIFLFASTFSFFDGCATVFKGYEDDVTLTRFPEGTKVFSQDNIEIPVFNITKTKFFRLPGRELFDSVVVVRKYIMLRSNTDHVLLFKNQDEETKVHVYPRLSGGWFILDVITGTFFVDWYTGNWNHFKDINFYTTQ